MRSVKHVLAAGLCMAFLAVCHAPQLPATQPPVTLPATTLSPIIHPSTTQPPTTQFPITQPTSVELTIEENIYSTAENHLPETYICETSSTETTPTFFTTEEVITSSSPPTVEEVTSTSPPPTAEEVTSTSPPPTTEETTTTPPPPSTEETVTTAEPATAPAPVLNRGHAEEAFQLQNQLLSEQEVIPLQWSESLYQIAAQRVQEITDNYSHNGCPDWVAENILMGTNRPDLAVQIWYDSPGHQRNMLAGWTYGAIANYGFYWVAIYAMAECP